MGKLSWRVDRPPPFAFVTPDQHVQPFGKSLAPKHAHLHSFSLRVDDIAGAKPKEHCFATSPRLTNPLEPRYQLPHSNYVQPGPPVQRFIRNAIDISDIPGAQCIADSNTQSLVHQRRHWELHSMVQAASQDTSRSCTHNFRLDCSDVEGAAPGWQPDWKIAAKARHASLQPATAPVQRHLDRPTRPTNYHKDIEKSSPGRSSNADIHQAQVQAANSAADRRTTAQQLLQRRVVTVGSAAVSSLWRQFRKCDREASGKLSSCEFAAALQSSKLGLSSAEVLQVANGLADSSGLLDYRPIGRMLQSQASAKLNPQKPGCPNVGMKKPPLPRIGSSVAASRKSSGSGQTAKQGNGAGQETAELLGSTAAASVQPQPQPGSRAVSDHDVTAQALLRPTHSNTEAQLVTHAGAIAAASQQVASRAECGAGRAGTSALPRSVRPETAPVKRSPGPPAQKVPYFFGKGQIDMQQPYHWKPSQDTTTILGVASKGGYERPWSTLRARCQAVQGVPGQQAQDAAAPRGSAGCKHASFHDDSPVFRRPVSALASVDVSHRDSQETRRQKGSLIEDMMTIRRL